MSDLLYGFSAEDGNYSHAVDGTHPDITICGKIQDPKVSGTWAEAPDPRCQDCIVKAD